MQIATAHGAIWACVLAGFYSASGVGEVVLQRAASSASILPKPPGAPLSDDAWCHATPYDPDRAYHGAIAEPGAWYDDYAAGFGDA